MIEIHESDDSKSNLYPKMTPATICLPLFSFFEVFVFFYNMDNFYILITPFLYQNFLNSDLEQILQIFHSSWYVFNGTVSVPMLTQILFHLYVWHYPKSAK